MPKVAYSEQDKEQIRIQLITIALELMAKQGIQHTTVDHLSHTPASPDLSLLLFSLPTTPHPF